jgi:hypothetical protein
MDTKEHRQLGRRVASEADYLLQALPAFFQARKQVGHADVPLRRLAFANRLWWNNFPRLGLNGADNGGRVGSANRTGLG